MIYPVRYPESRPMSDYSDTQLTSATQSPNEAVRAAARAEQRVRAEARRIRRENEAALAALEARSTPPTLEQAREMNRMLAAIEAKERQRAEQEVLDSIMALDDETQPNRPREKEIPSE